MTVLHRVTSLATRFGATLLWATLFWATLFWATLFLLTGLWPQPALAAGTGGGGAIAPMTSGKSKSPEQIAQTQYRLGLKQKNRALKSQTKAATAKTDKARDKQLARAEKAFDKAAEHYKKVLQVDPRHYEAANELGYALRKNGDFKNAVGAYNYALQLQPDFLQAIEYRGEAFMALGFFEEARQSYLRLYREDQTLAAQLMGAMHQWVERRTDGGDDLSEAEQAFADWVKERKRLVGFSASPDAQPQTSAW